MQPVLNSPMTAYDVIEPLRREGLAHQIVAGFHAGPTGLLPAGGDLARCLQARPAESLLQPIHLAADVPGTGLDAAVPLAEGLSRACRGTAMGGRLRLILDGLSPRLRGNLEWGRCDTPGGGSIPTPAGEPLPPFSARPRPRVYPRACGGTASSVLRSASASGLSPRLRGNRINSQRSSVYPRACGGTAGPTLSHYGGTRSIPAPAGNLTCCNTASPGNGLSPRLRGNRQEVHYRQSIQRSIPAPAGDPPAPSRRGFRPGLSPRLRGNHIGGEAGLVRVGSIPAPAGEPWSATNS